MALTKTLAQLRAMLLRRAGFSASGTSVSLDADTLNDILNDAVFEGWDVIVNKWLDYYTGSTIVAVTADEDTYALPADFYKLRVVWMAEGERYTRLKPASLDDAHKYTGQSVGARGDYRYRITNRNLVMMPLPSSAESLRVFYVPHKTVMVNDADTLTLEVPIELKYILAIGWRDILELQNLDPSPAIAKMQQYEAKLRTAADSLDAGEPFYLGTPPFDDAEDLL